MMGRVTEWLRLRPEPGYGIDPAIATPTDDGDGTVTRIFEPVEAWLGQVPGLVWVGLLLITGAVTVITLPVARRQARRAGARSAGHTDTEQGDQALFLAAMIPAALFLTAVLAGSFRGLAAFGRDTLRWADGWEYLVPGTLDGVALSFGFLAFRAIKRGQSPDRANRLVWAAALASAVINFAHEAGLPDGSWLGGAYLGLMSVFGMLIFHEFLAQFEEGAEAVHRKTPKFGLRWITWPTNTACAWVAWHNHPAPDGVSATVAAAVAHLEDVRASKRAKLAATEHPAPWWTPILPWVRIRQLDASAEAERAAGDKQRAELTAAAEESRRAEESKARRLADDIANLAASREQDKIAAERSIAALRSELGSVRATLSESAAAALEALNRQHAQALSEMTEKHAEELARVRAESATVNLDRYRETHTGKRGRQQPESAPRRVVLSDDQAAQKCIAAHPEPDFVWSYRLVADTAGVGQKRAPDIIAAIEKRHANSAAGLPGSHAREASGGESADDPEERSA
jgi:hypothetical protein